MSFETQQGASTCGMASLKYAVSLLGAGLRRNEEIGEDHIRAKIRKSGWRVFVDGTSESDLRRAAKQLGMTMQFRRFWKRDPDAVLTRLRRATRQGHPCIVSVHSDDEPFYHWVCVAGLSGEWALVFDPATTDEDLSTSVYWPADNSGDADFSPALMKVSRLREWIDIGDELEDEIQDDYGGEHHLFLEIAVAPGRRREFVPGMVNEALVRRMRRDLDLAESFDQYIDDLRDIFGTPPWNGDAKGVPAYQFIQRNRKRLDDLFRTWTLTEYCDRGCVEEEIQNLLAITRCYGFRVKPGDEHRVWANLAFHLGWFAATCTYEVEKFE